MVVAMASTACNGSTWVTGTGSRSVKVTYGGQLPAGPIEEHDQGTGPCPTCMYDMSLNAIIGELDSSASFGSGRFPVQWMKAVYKNNGVVQSTELIDIGAGNIGANIVHEVGETTFDEVFLQWKDVENVIEMGTESLLFES